MIPTIYLAVLGTALFLYFCALMILRHILPRINENPKRTDLPGISIVVSLHNETANCQELILHLKSQTYLGKLDFILVDDRSTDNTYEMLLELTGDDTRFKIIRIVDILPGFAPKKRALDTAIQHSDKEIILHTDADGRPEPEWAGSMAACFSPGTGMVLGYAPYTKKRYSIIQNMLALEYFSQAAVAAATTAAGHPATCVGTNLAYRRDLYESLNGFGQFSGFTSGDDDLFLTRVRSETDTKIQYNCEPESFVYNAPPNSWKQFYNQRLRFASKGFNYDLKTTAGLVVLYLFNLMMFLSPALLFIKSDLWPFLILFWLFKAGSEYLFMRKAMDLYRHKYSIITFLAAFTLHVPYVVWFGAAAQFLSYQWKDQTR